jgi:hypothetical protein
LDAQKLREIVNRSGFPLQLGLQHVLEDSASQHGWRVKFEEHSWSNSRDGQSGFIDLVIEDRNKSTVLVIECKRVLDQDWIFLCSEREANDRRFCKGWVSYYNGERLSYFDWHQLTAEPDCPQSSYCVVNGQDQKARPMLERTAGEIISATEALATEEAPLAFANHEEIKVYFSVIVTTARLQVCTVDTAKINIEDGTIDESMHEERPFIRFRKQLSTAPARNDESAFGIDNERALPSAKEHVVFVVNSKNFLSFVEQFEFNENRVKYLWRRS